MPTTIPCPSCKVSLKAPDNLLGKTINCPKCKKPVKLLAPGAAAATVSTKPAAPAPAPKPAAPPEKKTVPAGPAVTKPAAKAVKKAPPKEEPDEDLDPVDELESAPEPEEAAESEEPAAAEDAAEEPAEEEEDGESEGGVSKVAAKFLDRKVFLIKGQSGIFSMNAAWDFLDPDTKKKTGTAVERPEGILQAIRFFLRRNWLPSKIEVREEKTNELVFIIRRPAYFFNCTLEVRDADHKLLAKFTYKPLSRLVGKPMDILRKKQEKFATCQFYFLKGRVDLVDDKGKELANMMTESAYTKAIKIYWAPRGGSYYVTFNKPLVDKPHEKMIFLSVTLALDLLQEDSKASSGKGGISIGT
jgi:hypothetical protein